MHFHLIIVLLTLMAFPGQSDHPLSIRVEGMVELKGTLMIAIYQDGQKLTEDVFFSKAEIPISESSIPLTTVHLPEGRYAISVFHDLNNDRKLNTNFLGIPTEPYGFSITRGMFGPPSFEKASFLVPDHSEIIIEIE